jgi:hypothetical protein
MAAEHRLVLAFHRHPITLAAVREHFPPLLPRFSSPQEN